MEAMNWRDVQTAITGLMEDDATADLFALAVRDAINEAECASSLGALIHGWMKSHTKDGVVSWEYQSGTAAAAAMASSEIMKGSFYG